MRKSGERAEIQDVMRMFVFQGRSQERDRDFTRERQVLKATIIE